MRINQRKTSLRGLRIFCVAAKYSNYSRAAEELSVTASAVSHQIKSLEDELGLELFVRDKRELRLSEQGQRLYQEIAPAIENIDDIIADVQSASAKKALRVSVQPFFASECFVPRIDEFRKEYPDIEIYVDTSDETSERHPSSADASIRLFRQPPANLESDVLFPLRLVPACSPEFLKRYGPRKSKPLEPFPILVHTSRPESWKAWSRETGIELPNATSVVRLDSMIAVARAAERGVGAALVPVPLSEYWFKYRALVTLFPDIVTLPEQYHLVYGKNKIDDPSVKALRAWTLKTFGDW